MQFNNIHYLDEELWEIVMERPLVALKSTPAGDRDIPVYKDKNIHVYQMNLLDRDFVAGHSSGVSVICRCLIGHDGSPVRRALIPFKKLQ